MTQKVKLGLQDLTVTLPQIFTIMASVGSFLVASFLVLNIYFATKAEVKAMAGNVEYIKGFFDDMVKAEVDKRTEDKDRRVNK